MEDSKNMFWGLVVKPNKRYETEVQEAFRITKACLVPSTAEGKVTTLFIETENNEEFILANLSLKNFNETLEISFNEGQKICFRVSGPGTIHLTGNLLELDEGFDDDAYDEGDSEDEIVDELKNLKWTKQQLKQLNDNADSDDDDDDDESDNDENENEEESEDDEASEEDDSEEMDDEELTDLINDTEVLSQICLDKEATKPVMAKVDTEITAAKTTNGLDNQKTPSKETVPQESKTPKTPKVETVTPKKAKDAQIDSKTPKTSKGETDTPKKAKDAQKDTKAPQTPKVTDTPKKAKDAQISEKTPKKTVKNGIIIEDLVEGAGEACKNGNGVGMYYRGNLKTSKKAFDACQSGKPFRFKLGAGNVIKGWDLGVLGMKVGGKRRLTIPSVMGYGKRGAPPDIPPNSTLVFDVECKFIYKGEQY